MLLTIAVPTYNRAYLLDSFYSRLYDVVKNYPSKFEILVSNNASIDETSTICKKWEAPFSSIATFRYAEQRENIGVAKNIVYLFEHAQGEYLILLPDDDEIVAENLPAVLDILETKSPSAIIQNVWNGFQVIDKNGVVTYAEAAALFYVYGNAWAAIVNTKQAVTAIKSRALKDQIETIVWPQTVMGFLAMHDAEKDILVVNFEIGRNSAGNQNITNKKYWSISLYGLLKAANIVDASTNNKLASKAFFKLKNNGFKSHIFSILFYSLVSENYSTLQLRQLLRKSYGVRGWLWSILLMISDKFPIIFLFVGMFVYTFVHKKSPLKYLQLIRKNKMQYANQLKGIKSTNMRFDDWF